MVEQTPRTKFRTNLLLSSDLSRQFQLLQFVIKLLHELLPFDRGGALYQLAPRLFDLVLLRKIRRWCVSRAVVNPPVVLRVNLPFDSDTEPFSRCMFSVFWPHGRCRESRRTGRRSSWPLPSFLPSRASPSSIKCAGDAFTLRCARSG